MKLQSVSVNGMTWSLQQQYRAKSTVVDSACCVVMNLPCCSKRPSFESSSGGSAGAGKGAADMDAGAAAMVHLRVLAGGGENNGQLGDCWFAQ